MHESTYPEPSILEYQEIASFVDLTDEELAARRKWFEDRHNDLTADIPGNEVAANRLATRVGINMTMWEAAGVEQKRRHAQRLSQ